MAQKRKPEPRVSIALEKTELTRSDTLRGTLKVARGPNRPRKLALRWVDGFGRTVARSTKRVPEDVGQIAFSFRAAPGMCLGNRIVAETSEDVPVAEAGFVVTPDPQPWDDYQVIMYYAYAPHQQPRLRDVGITGGMIQSRTRLMDTSNTPTSIWWSHGYRYYCEQILSDVYAEYHRHRQGLPKHIRQTEAKELYKKDRSVLDALIRKPCFHDPAVRRKIEKVLPEVVRVNGKFAPIFYSLCDEAGLGDLVTAWDFCFDPRTLRAMRRWLQAQYGTLKDLNAAWDTDFPSWSKVVPLTTDRMMARGDDNLSPWADHRAFMDLTFAEAVKWGADAVLAADPEARTGLVGCQMPSAFGGYDYWLLANAMNTIEPYNIGNNREIWRSFAPDAVAVTTTFGFGDQEVWRLWYQMLHGDRGIIIYDEKNRYLEPSGKPTALGRAVAPVYKELTGGLCKLLSASERTHQPVTIHYSQASIRAHWMFEARPEGQDWLERGSAAERIRSDFLRLRESTVKLLEDQQLQYTFTAYEQLERRHLDTSGDRLLFLPQSIAMSKGEVAAVRRFVRNGGTVIADGRLALMDEHCKRLPKGRLDSLFGIRRTDQDWAPGRPGLKPTGVRVDGIDVPEGRLKKVAAAEPGVQVNPSSGAVALYADSAGVPAVIVRDHGPGRTVYLNLDLTDYHRWRLRPPEGDDCLALVRSLTASAGIVPEYTVTRPDGSPLPAVEVHPFVNGDVRILGIHRNPQLRVGELGPPRYRTNKAFERRERIRVDLGARYRVYDIRRKVDLGTTRRVDLTLDPYQPTVLGLFPRVARKVKLEAPGRAARGKAIRFKVAVDTAQPAARHACRVEIAGPRGRVLPLYSRNILAARGKGSGMFYLALDDPAGDYILSVRDIASGKTARKTIAVD